MKKWILSLSFFWMAWSAQAQERVGLSACYEAARSNYPLLKQKDMQAQIAALQVLNLQKVRQLPQLTLNGQASWQNEVTQIPISLPNLNIESLSRDQYRLTLDASYLLFDGQASTLQAQVQQANGAVEQQKVEVELYKLRQQVNAIYFAVLLGDKTIAQLNLTKEDLQKKLDQVNVTVKNGAVLQSNADQIKSEILKTEQKITEAKSLKHAYVKSLSMLINDTLDAENVLLQTPSEGSQIPFYNISQRPDLILLQQQQVNLEAMKGLTKAKTTPKFGAFAQLGYSKPGLDPFSTIFDPYYLAGLKLSWNIWNWNASKNERQIYSIQQDMLDQQMETLDVNVKLQAIQQQEEMTKLRTLIEQDQQLIDLRKKISKTASTQVDNGVITVTDYLAQVNAEYQAELSLTTHQLQLAYAYVNYETTLGK